jgi:hypothetical protein
MRSGSGGRFCARDTPARGIYHARFAACILGNHVESVVLDYIDMRGDYIAHVVYSVIVEVDVYIRIV